MPPRSEVRPYRALSKNVRPIHVAVVHRPIQRFRDHLITIGWQAQNSVGAVGVGQHSDRRLSDIRKAAEWIAPGRGIGEHMRPENGRATQTHAARDPSSRHIRRRLRIEYRGPRYIVPTEL